MTDIAEPDLFDRYVRPRESALDPYDLMSATVSKEVHENGRAKYRFVLERVWDAQRPTALWIMLNPSTADAFEDDPTIRRVVSFSKTYGMGACRVINLFADLAGMNAQAGLTIVAWGAQVDGRDTHDMVDWVREHSYGAWCLGKTKSGQPKHPLYLDGATALDPW
jgi:hypothetical protein